MVPFECVRIRSKNLVAFMVTLTSEDDPVTIPVLPSKASETSISVTPANKEARN
jgi:hypothetical protein